MIKNEQIQHTETASGKGENCRRVIAIASGKGGTGKTTLATTLALLATEPTVYVDCDVEAPNGHLFLNPEITGQETVSIPVPEIDSSRCTGCGECSRFCRFHALAGLGKNVLVFPELCHGCGGCTKVCLPGAIHETSLEIGEVELGKAGTIGFIHGRLKVGHPMSPPLIRAVKKRIPAGAIAFVDCPPGTACPAVTAITGCDYAILVTEPTPFGLHDLTLAVATVRVLGVPFGVVVNRMGIGDSRVHHYCAEQQIPVLLEIPDDRRIAEGYARGHMIPESAPELRTRFMNLLETVTETGPAPNSKGACRT